MFYSFRALKFRFRVLGSKKSTEFPLLSFRFRTLDITRNYKKIAFFSVFSALRLFLEKKFFYDFGPCSKTRSKNFYDFGHWSFLELKIFLMVLGQISSIFFKTA